MMICHHSFMRICRSILTSLLFIAAANTQAAGFALIEQSVSSMGTAYAGAGSAGEDASYMFFNPATMSLLEGEQVTNGLHIVLPTSEFSGGNMYNPDNLAIIGAGLDGGIPVGSQGNGGNGGTVGVVPHLAYVRDLNEKTKIGITVNAPFGLKTEYSDDWAGRYSAIESEILSLNINPNIAFQVNDQTTIGFGVSAMYAKLKLRQAVDDGLLGVLNGFGETPPFDDWFPGSSELDSTATHSVDDWGFGYNFGVLFEPSDQTRFGLAYRSQVNVDLRGKFKTDSLVTSSKGAGTDVTLPDTLLLSAYHEVSPKTAIMADILWTRWSEVPELSIAYDNGTSNTFHLDWENTVRVAIGASHRYNEKWIVRTGVAFDESPGPSADLRLASLPDDDRIWLDFGVGYQHSKQLSFDLGYAHLFIDDPKINSSDADSSLVPGADGLHLLTGQYDADVDIISAQLNYKFH